jgi:branched-chain amino acid transport system permease protein
MAFEIVAASRAEQAKTTPWRHAIRTGLALGAANLFMAAVGILMMFQNRPIIVDTLSLGYATLGITLFAAGLLVARRGLFGHRDPTIMAGVVAGALAAGLPALLAVLMSLVDLRSVFVALNPPLFIMLTFGQQPALLGGVYLILLGAVLGGAGALFPFLADRIRRPLAGGLIAAGLAGILQELIRPILANSRVTKPLYDLLYTWSGLTLRGALIIVVVVGLALLLWDLNRGRIETALGGLEPSARRRLRLGCWGAIALLLALFPMFAGNFIGQVLLVVGLFTLMGMGLNLEVGMAGLLDLGFVAFYAVGAYTTMRWPSCRSGRRCRSPCSSR